VPTLTLPEIEGRLHRALHDGRFQTALELARALFKQDPSQPHRELLEKAVLSRARQLRTQGHATDAATVLDHAAVLNNSPAWLAQVAEEYAACGQAQRALSLLEGVQDGELRSRILEQAADAAVSQGKAGHQQLPEALRGQLEVILNAFAQVERGQDDAARTTLQGVGLQSPFLEWKVFLRGMQAYYQKDDARALENWQRLSEKRLPARLAAPLRFLIDADFRRVQPPATQAVLQRQADRLLSSGLIPSLRAIQAALANEEQLPQAFRLADQVVGALRREAPEQVARLAACFYWAIVHHGQKEDLGRYKRVFGAPADDQQLSRLEALAVEEHGWMTEAHEAWQRYEKCVEAQPGIWPGEQANRVRALVWSHMGHNADCIPEIKDLNSLPPFLRDHPGRPRPLKPTAEECYRRSIALAPQTLEPHELLFQHFKDKEKSGKAIEAGRRLLERFPEHVKTLEALAKLLMEKQQYAEAISLFERALKANPLESRLRAQLSSAHTYHARTFAETNHFDEARREYQAALTLGEDKDSHTVLCKWSACEFKAAAVERAEELLQKAHAKAGNRLAVAYSMLIENIRLKLPRQLKSRFDKEFKESLAEPPTGASAHAVAVTASSHRLAGVNYHGQKTHEKQILSYLDRARTVEFSELEIGGVCLALKVLESRRLLQSYLQLGQHRFPTSPLFFLMEAEDYLEGGPGRASFWRAEDLLKKARELATAMPRDDRQKAFLDTIQEQEQALRALNPFASLLGGGDSESMLDHLFGNVDFDEDDGDEFDDDEIEDW
jgi:tetratricopeptide (TPR) repeat protein